MTALGPRQLEELRWIQRLPNGSVAPPNRVLRSLRARELLARSELSVGGWTCVFGKWVARYRWTITAKGVAVLAGEKWVERGEEVKGERDS
jgi:hypothetical protein